MSLLTWTPRTTPMDNGVLYGCCWSPDLNRFVAVGGPDNTNQIITSSNGVVWDGQGTPFGGTDGFGQGHGVCWSPTLGIFVAVGFSVEVGVSIFTSPDGFTWTGRSSPYDGQELMCVAWSEVAQLFVAGGVSTGPDVPAFITSPDGITWTASPSYFDDGGTAYGVAYKDTFEERWTVSGVDPTGMRTLMTTTDPTAMAAWTFVLSDLDGGVARGVFWLPTAGIFVALGGSGSPTAVGKIVTSPDGITWTTAGTQPFADNFAQATAAAQGGHDIIVAGASGADAPLAQSDDADVWVTNTADILNCNSICYSPLLDLFLAVGQDIALPGTVAVTAPSVEPPLPPSARFFQGYQWRFVVTNLNLRVLTMLDKLASNRTATIVLNVPAVATGTVPSDNPEVNLVANDGFPFVAQSNRFLLGFRREGGTPPWKIRFAGIIMQVDDKADSSTQAGDAVTNYTAWDPWQYLYSRPVRVGDGSIPSPRGLIFEDVKGSEIVKVLLQRTADHDGPTYILMDDANFEDTARIDITFEQGTSVGDALTQLVGTGTLDIEMRPIYDPAADDVNIVEVHVYTQAGTERDNAVFAWDQPSLSLVGIERLLDASTPDAIANWIQFFNGQGGPKVPDADGDFPTAKDDDSIALYGTYTGLQFFPGQTVPAAVRAFALAELNLRKLGRETVTLTPSAERAPIPLIEYGLGDRVPVYASKRLRLALSGYQRVYGIPFEISDDGLETVRELLASPQDGSS